MTGEKVFPESQASSVAAMLSSVKLCSSFDLHGVVGEGVIRARTGESVQTVLTNDELMSVAERLGKPVNDKRSVDKLEWKPSNADMFKHAMKMMEASDSSHAPAVKPSSPKM